MDGRRRGLAVRSGGRGEGLRRAEPASPAGGFACSAGLGGRGSAWLSGPGAGRVWALAAERTPSPGARPFGPRPGWTGPGEESAEERVS